ncbi:MAG: sigma-70 family RNA polymerase sigma factor [Clostridia bacterium]|nr:sigma-70 family RNA polymerase sigma factor [Clostridia bacterium]
MDGTNKTLCEALWAQFGPRLRVLCEVRLSGLPDEVDDVISEVFTALCEKLEKSGMPEHPQAWLCGVLKNITNTRLREICEKKATELPLTEKETELPYEASGTELDEKTDEIFAADIADRVRDIGGGDEDDRFRRFRAGRYAPQRGNFLFAEV